MQGSFLLAENIAKLFHFAFQTACEKTISAIHIILKRTHEAMIRKFSMWLLVQYALKPLVVQFLINPFSSLGTIIFCRDITNHSPFHILFSL